MKELNLLVWLTQLGLSIAAPLGILSFLGVWLRQKFDLGVWVVVLGFVLGIVCAIDGFKNAMRAMELMEKNGRRAKKKKDEPPPVSFNNHE